MKKFNYLIGALAIVGASCSSNDEIANVQAVQEKAQTTQAIGFSPLTKGSTRSTVITDIKNITSFRVRGTWSTKAVSEEIPAAALANTVWIEGEKKTLGSGTGEVATPVAGAVYQGFGNKGLEIVNNNGWNYKNASEMQYWPFIASGVTGTGESQLVTGYKCLTLDFNAVTPATSNLELDKPSYTYETPTVANMTDICYATASGTNKDAPIALNFNHILSQIVVKVKKANNYTVDIQKVVIGGVKVKGSVSLNAITKTPTEVIWLADANSDIKSYDIFNSATAYSVPASAESESPIKITPSGQELLLMPQDVSPWVPGEEVNSSKKPADSNLGYIAVTYRAKKSESATWATGSGEGYTTTYYPLTAKWFMGKIYAYTLLFGGVSDPDKPVPDDPTNPDPGKDNPGGYDEDGNAKVPSVPITFTATVSDWASQNVDVSF